MLWWKKTERYLWAVLIVAAILSIASMAMASNTTTTMEPHSSHAGGEHGANDTHDEAHLPLVTCPAFILPILNPPGTPEDEITVLATEEEVDELIHTTILQVFVVNYNAVQYPVLISCLLLAITLLRMLTRSTRIGDILPDSCVVIMFGILIGLYVEYSNGSTGELNLSIEAFFFYILPPIIFEAGYVQCQNRVFMDNLGSIVLNAIIGTVFNTFAIAGLMYAISMGIGLEIEFIEVLVFGALIAAVDPVAVLTVFEEVHVNHTLHTIVFGESILNDGVAVVLYRICVALAYRNNLLTDGLDVGSSFGTGIASFAVVFLGGLIMGIVHGLVAAFITRFLVTGSVRFLEPMILIVVGYLSYINAELFHFSGIVSIMVCGMMLRHYASKNISKDSRTSVEYFLKLIAGTAETIVFVLLGVILVTSVGDGWNTAFILSGYFVCFLVRFIGVLLLSTLINTIRHDKISFRDQLVIAYGGLRGAIAFALAFILQEDKVVCFDGEDYAHDAEAPVVDVFRHKDLFVSTTIMIVMLTVFIQGTTIKPLLNLLGIELAVEHKQTGFEKLNGKLVDQAMEVVSQITGKHTSSWLRDFYERFDLKFQRWLVKPGADYLKMLESAESAHMDSVLMKMWKKRDEALQAREDHDLDELDRPNNQWQRAHRGFGSVLRDIDMLGAETRHMAAPSDAGTHTSPHEQTQSAQILYRILSAKNDPRADIFFERNEPQLKIFDDDADVVVGPHQREADTDNDSARSMAGSTTSLEGLLTEGELESAKKFASDTELYKRDTTHDHAMGETFVPLVQAEPIASAAAETRAVDIDPELLKTLKPIHEYTI
eukprot:m.91377 g.91377  ORF g.91377 m.91377 type:complete len:829 (+) comp12945_c2_seq1:183-2669(+)